jgi:HEAT repeat protein
MSRHKARYIRERAVSCLAAIASPQVVPPLAGFLNDKDTTVRKMAVEALGEVGDSGALGALAKAAEDKKGAVRGAAKKAMKQVQARVG